MADRKVTISVETTADTKGLDATNQKLDDLGKKAEDGGKKSKGAADSAQKFGQATGRAAEMVGSLTGAIGANSAAASQMSAGLRVMKSLAEGSATGLAGIATVLLGVVVSAYTAYRRNVEASKEALKKFLDQIEENKRAQETAGVDKLAAQYDVLRKSIDDAAAALDRIDTAQNAADAAEKEGMMTDITRREKQALSGLASSDEAGAARVQAKFANERREVDYKFQVRASEREAAARGGAVSEAESKLRITGADVNNAKQAMDDFAARIRTVNEQLADLYGRKAPRNDIVDTIMGPGGIPIVVGRRSVVDEAEQERQASALRNQLVERDKDGKSTGRGLDANYMAAAAQYSTALDRQETERNEVNARRVEAEAAGLRLSSLQSEGPKIIALESSLSGRDVSAKEKEQRKLLIKDKELEDQREEIIIEMGRDTAYRDESMARNKAAKFRLSGFKPGIDRSGGRLVKRSSLEESAQQAANEAEFLNNNLTARLQTLARALKSVNEKIKASRESD